jgi:cardiolipin synthase
LRDLANSLTLARLLLAPVVVWAIVARQFGAALAVLLVAGVTDVLDGLAARRFGGATRVGAYLDPIADKLLLSASYVALGAAGLVPWWLVILIFGRDILILAMAGLALAFTKNREFPPSVWGKISTLCQIAAAVAVLSDGAFPGLRAPLDPVFWTAAATTAWSGAAYAWRGLRCMVGLERGGDAR